MLFHEDVVPTYKSSLSTLNLPGLLMDKINSIATLAHLMS